MHKGSYIEVIINQTFNLEFLIVTGLNVDGYLHITNNAVSCIN